MTKEGVLRGTSIHRMPEPDRWSVAEFDELRGLPWLLRPDRQTRTTMPRPMNVEASEIGAPVQVDSTEPQIRSKYITRSLIKDFGHTPGCPGCDALLVKGPQRGHSKACRANIIAKIQAGLDKEEATVTGGKRAGAQEAEVEVKRRPSPDDGEIAAGEALGMPIDDEGMLAEDVGPSKKRKGGNIDELFEESAGTASGSAGPGMMGQDPTAAATAATPEAASPSGTKRKEPPEGDGDNIDIGYLGRHVELAYLQNGIVLDAKEAKDIGNCLGQLGCGKGDVSEIFSPPRFSAAAQFAGLRPGFAVDLETMKPDGTHWDLDNRADVLNVKAMIQDEDPYLVTGSPPCDPFSKLQNLSKHKRDPKVVADNLARGKRHIRTCIGIYRERMDKGRYFLHEHPKGATSWDMEEMKELMKDPRVYVVQGPMCRWDMKATDAQGEGYVRKETVWVTNSICLAETLQGVCKNVKAGREIHRHVHLINGRARAAQVYPPKMVKAVVLGIRDQLIMDGEMPGLNALDEDGYGKAGPVPDENEYGIDDFMEQDGGLWMTCQEPS